MRTGGGDHRGQLWRSPPEKLSVQAAQFVRLRLFLARRKLHCLVVGSENASESQDFEMVAVGIQANPQIFGCGVGVGASLRLIAPVLGGPDCRMIGSPGRPGLSIDRCMQTGRDLPCDLEL